MVVDPDVDLHDPGQRRERALAPAFLAVIAVGGVLGAEARYALERLVDSPADGWPWATFAVNVVGSLLLGVLMGVLGRLDRPHPLARPFLGVGFLGGFTTFSTAMVQVPPLLSAGRPGLALLYLAGSAVTALGGAAAGLWAVRGRAGAAR
ncbi:fluoride efflux transporter FluC [Geodermatophilus sp. SYSU D00691]